MHKEIPQQKLEKKDFIEVEFTGRIKDTNEIFDSNIKEDLEKLPDYNLNSAKPFIFALGQGMFLQSIDEYILKNSEVGKKYFIILQPEQAFGKRNSEFIQLIPINIFLKQKINPLPGVLFNFDGRTGKILSVSGGRVMVDFNHPLAGKTLTYEIKILRKIEELDEKIRSFINFLFKKDFEFSLDEKNKKITIKVEKEMKQFIELFTGKFTEIFDLNLEVKEI